ncbi:MAG: SRPBCC domain-containing protein [Acidimicrobiales bacterium]
MKVRFESDRSDVWSALTDPQRLAHWYGSVEGDLRIGGEFTAFVTASEWNGRGRIDACIPHVKLEVTTWEEEGSEKLLMAELVEDGVVTTLVLDVKGLPLDLVWAFGVGWQILMEDLGTYLSGQKGMNAPSRWDELEAVYREMPVVPHSVP